MPPVFPSNIEVWLLAAIAISALGSSIIYAFKPGPRLFWVSLPLLAWTLLGGLLLASLHLLVYGGRGDARLMLENRSPDIFDPLGIGLMGSLVGVALLAIGRRRAARR